MIKQLSENNSSCEQDFKFQLAAKAIVSDLFERNEKRHWIDFTCSVVLTYFAVSVFLALPLNSTMAWVCFMAGGGLVYRASLFVHEIVHLPAKSMIGFQRFWNLFAGVPMLVPSFSYSSHIHRRNTREDTFWELLTWFRAVVMIGLVVGVMPLIRLPKLLMVATFVLTLNHLRTLAAHRYTNHDGEAVSHLDQFLDSTNVTGNWLTEVFCPLGLRYHALHHLFPGIPYHNLSVAHRRLSNLLPEDSPYHKATYPNVRSVIAELLTNLRK